MKDQIHPGHNQKIGKWGEDCAFTFLESKGFTMMARNVRTPAGEIDLIALDNGCAVFVEVKTRSHHQAGYPEEAVTEEKLEHMIDSAEHWLQDHPEYENNWRLDVVAVTGEINTQNPQIEWFENAA
ncbi:MAG: YraN family protein [Anaerolineaceae bacterium]